MEILWIVLGFILILIGTAGAVLPLPGPPLSFLGMLAAQQSDRINFSDEVLYGFGIVTFTITVLDYFIPIWGAKKFGGTKWGSYGSAIGLIVGMFLGPFGLFIGAFVGAFLGEYLSDKNHNKAFRAAFGSFLGLLAGILGKTLLCISMLITTIYYLFI